MVAALALGGCLKPPPEATNPAVLPGPNDNVIRIEIEAVQVTKDGPRNVTEKFPSVILNAVNGNVPPEPIMMGNGLPSTNWQAGPMTYVPGKETGVVLSQEPGAGKGIVIGSLSIESLANSIEPKALVINCRFFVRLSPLTGGDGQYHEDRTKFQTGTGKKVTCLISYRFAMP